MADVVVMPKLGLLMETGTVGAWKVAEGDAVSVGQVIAEITTEKIVYELESQVEGMLLSIILPENGEAPVGEPIAVIGRPGEDISALGGPSGETTTASAVASSTTTTAAVGSRAPAEAQAVSGAPAPSHVPMRPPGERIVASPAARKLAGELGVDLAYVAGSGPEGRITVEDVASAHAERAAAPVAAGAFATPTARKMAADLGVDLAGVEGGAAGGRVRAEDVVRAATGPGGSSVVTAAPPSPAPASAPAGIPAATTTAADIRGGVLEEIPYAGMRMIIGEHMDRSRTIAPTVTYCGTADVQQLKELLARVNANRSANDKINITAVTIKAAALSLERMPRINSTLEGGVIRVWRGINIGVAVALKEGLIVPVIREANTKRLSEIAREVKELAAKAREGRLLPDDISGGTFTVSTVGSYRSVDFFNPIINQPESAILGVGRMLDTVVVVDGLPVVRATVGLSLTCDHRVIDGAPAAEFLRMVEDLLAEPFNMLV